MEPACRPPSEAGRTISTKDYCGNVGPNQCRVSCAAVYKEHNLNHKCLPFAVILSVLSTSAIATDSTSHYFCRGESTYPSAEGKKKRYAISVERKFPRGRPSETGTISLRAYDWADGSSDFRLDRGMIERFQFTGVSPKCDNWKRQ